MLRMADSVGHFPPGFDAYAGYGNGRYVNMVAAAKAAAGKPVLEIDVLNAGIGDVLDIEYRDAVPVEAPAWVLKRRAAGVKRPVVYSSASEMPAVKSYLDRAGIPRRNYRVWSAHYTFSPHLCGPKTCGYPVEADATQFSDKGGGGLWDESVLRDDFFKGVHISHPGHPLHGIWELLVAGKVVWKGVGAPAWVRLAAQFLAKAKLIRIKR